jgi:hypothetical protein
MTGLPRFTHCVVCGEPFSVANVYSRAGWIETQISGQCELCFDTLADIPEDITNGPQDYDRDDPGKR